MAFLDEDFSLFTKDRVSTPKSLKKAQALKEEQTINARSKDVFMVYKAYPRLKRSTSAQSINCQKLSRTCSYARNQNQERNDNALSWDK